MKNDRKQDTIFKEQKKRNISIWVHHICSKVLCGIQSFKDPFAFFEIGCYTSIFHSLDGLSTAYLSKLNSIYIPLPHWEALHRSDKHSCHIPHNPDRQSTFLFLFFTSLYNLNNKHHILCIYAYRTVWYIINCGVNRLIIPARNNKYRNIIGEQDGVLLYMEWLFLYMSTTRYIESLCFTIYTHLPM